MKFNPRNKHGYLQAAISALIILSIFCLSYYRIEYSYPHIPVRNFFFLNLASNSLGLLWHKDFIFCTISLIIFILLQLANIFYQSKKRNKTLSIIASAWFIVVSTTVHPLHDKIIEIMFGRSSELQLNTSYTCGFYLIVSLIAIQFILNFIPNNFLRRISCFVLDFFYDAPCGNQEEQQQHKELEKPDMSATPNKERLEKESLEKEFRALKAKVEQVEKKRLEREILKLEKEKLSIEIAILKDSLRNYEESEN